MTQFTFFDYKDTPNDPVKMATRIEIKQEYRNSAKSRQILAAAFLCNIVILLIMCVCLISSYWITADGYRQGLLYFCLDDSVVVRGDGAVAIHSTPLPFNLQEVLEEVRSGCYPNRNVTYLKICTILCLMIQLSALASACFTGLGIRLKGPKRLTCLRFAICTTLVVLICDISLLIIYPTQFAKELDISNRDVWELNGAYGLACGAAILAFGSLILLLATFSRQLNVYEAAPTRI